MSCIGCTVSDNSGEPKGCRSNGSCKTGGCNRLNTFDWLSQMEVTDPRPLDIVEVSFKNGARKAFHRVPDYLHVTTGDQVVVETGTGQDVGQICLSGELVRLQMKKKKVSRDAILHKVIRIAHKRDMERLQEARDMEMSTMIRARAIARTLGLEMKVGDVEYQADKRKATFYYTADGRVDFRELIRHYAREFRIKIEMRQIGARQESGRIGGMGSCGRELCCSTWLTDFKSVSTAAARYQNLAINQSKLSGQCGRLKCCLNYELDTYLDALEHFPDKADKLETEAGTATLIKTDIFKQLMFYAYDRGSGRGKMLMLKVDRVKEILAMNRRGEKPADLVQLESLFETDGEGRDYEDVTGVIELPPEKKKRSRKKRGRNQKRRKGKNSKRGGKNSKKNGG
ncbi:MAG: regulatory iron-sulfur-containing complex subunit RicT [Saprospiraceae bacterium]|nr:regulatory iron-sulfur-containing complex subunit RicT [Saprospiraceae bacterium]